MKPSKDDLIRDLLRLYIKYGPDDFSEALKDLKSGAALATFNDLAASFQDIASKTSLAKPGRNKDLRKPTKKALQRHDFLDIFPESEIGKRADLISFLDSMAKRYVLRSNAEIQAYANLLGIPAQEGRLDRPTMVRSIAKYMKSLSQADLENAMKSAKEIGDAGSSLERWSRIIVKPG